jgi:hypothetical protein
MLSTLAFLPHSSKSGTAPQTWRDDDDDDNDDDNDDDDDDDNDDDDNDDNDVHLIIYC